MNHLAQMNQQAAKAPSIDDTITALEKAGFLVESQFHDEIILTAPEGTTLEDFARSHILVKHPCESDLEYVKRIKNRAIEE